MPIKILLVTLLSFFYIGSVNASGIIDDDNFDSYNVGLLASQNNWSAWTFPSGSITNSSCLSGKCWTNVNGTNDRTTNIKTGASTSYLSMSFDYKITLAGKALSYGCIDSSLGDPYGAKRTVYSSDTNWHNMKFEYNSITKQYRNNVDNGGWSPWSNQTNGSDCDQIYFGDTTVGDYGFIYVDNFTGYYTFIEPEDVEVVDVAEEELEVSVASEEVDFDVNTVCHIGYPCYTRLFYPYGYENKNWILQEFTGTSTYETIDNGILPDEKIHKIQIFFPDQAEEVEKYYCIGIVDGETLTEKYCGLKADWTSLSLAEMYGFEEYNIASACDDMIAPTSTDSWLDSFSIDSWVYTIQCAGRKVIYWAITPQEQDFVRLDEQLDSTKKQFPINVYNDVYKRVSDLSSTTTPSIKMIGIFSGVELLSTSTMETNIAKGAYDQIYDIVKIIIYALTFIYFINYLMKIPKDPSI